MILRLFFVFFFSIKVKVGVKERQPSIFNSHAQECKLICIFFAKSIICTIFASESCEKCSVNT